MDRIGAREFRANVAATVRRAAGGERIVVTIDGRPAAQLGPLDPVDGTVTLDDLVARGLLEPPRRSDAAAEGEPVSLYAGVRLDRLLREIRG